MLNVHFLAIAVDKILYQIIEICLIFPTKKKQKKQNKKTNKKKQNKKKTKKNRQFMLWVLIRSASLWCV